MRAVKASSNSQNEWRSRALSLLGRPRRDPPPKVGMGRADARKLTALQTTARSAEVHLGCLRIGCSGHRESLCGGWSSIDTHSVPEDAPIVA